DLRRPGDKSFLLRRYCWCTGGRVLRPGLHRNRGCYLDLQLSGSAWRCLSNRLRCRDWRGLDRFISPRIVVSFLGEVGPALIADTLVTHINFQAEYKVSTRRAKLFEAVHS